MNKNLITLEEAVELVKLWGLVDLAIVLFRLGDKDIPILAADIGEITEDDLERLEGKPAQHAFELVSPSVLYVVSSVFEGNVISTIHHKSETALLSFPFIRNFEERWIPLPYYSVINGDDLGVKEFVPNNLRMYMEEHDSVEYAPQGDFSACLMNMAFAYCVAVLDWQDKKKDFN